MTRIDTGKWKDRGWWVSVDIDRKPSGRKHADLALDLLGNARERYDLLLESGNMMSRGIFTVEDDLRDLTGLLEIAGHWTGTSIYCSGKRLNTGDVRQLTKHLKCAANQAGCRSGNWEQRLAYLGCHLLKIGLRNYSLTALKNGERYWFRYLKSEKADNWHAYLDKCALAEAAQRSRLCPLFPARTPDIIEMLPSAVSLKPMNNHLFWVPTKYKIRTSWLCRYPPVVPNSECAYRKWINNLFIKIGDKRKEF